VDGEAGTDGGGHGLLNQEARRGAGPAGRFLDGSALHRGDGRRHADQHLGPVNPAHADAVQQDAEHAFGDFEIGDGTAPQRPLGHYVPRGPPDHLPGVGADGEDFAGARIECNDRGLVEHEALSLGVDERVGRPEVYGQIARHLATW
jgi:hypothetical protein